MGIVITRTKQLATAASANNICLSQSTAGAADLAINGSAASGGVATLDTQRRVLFTFAADETGHTFTVYGTNQGGNAIQEAVAGTTAGTTYTNLDFKTVARIAVSAATTGNLTVGTNTIGSMLWQSVDIMRQPINIGMQCVVGTGTVNYTVEWTAQDVNALAAGSYPTVFPHQILVGQTTDASGSFTTPLAYFRVTVNSGTDPVTLTYEQAGP